MYQWLSNVIKNEYQFIKCLKKNEFGNVCVYRNNRTKRKVIVKHIQNGSEIYRKLLKVKSDHLPQIYEVVTGREDTIVLEEYIEGMHVADVLEGGLYTEEGMVEVCNQICDALSVLHSFGMIHRDVKPENIMITKEGNVKLIDFNASKIHREGNEKDTRVLGTTGFAAPEQYGISQSDERTDVYAMGVLINVMLTGEHPSKKMCEGKMKKVVKKAVSINPDDRYQSCEELKVALKH